jgi:hypothetical protein
MSLLENFEEYFGATFQDDQFQVNKLGHCKGNNRIGAVKKLNRIRNVLRKRNWTIFVRDLRLPQEHLLYYYFRRRLFRKYLYEGQLIVTTLTVKYRGISGFEGT